MSAIRHKQIYMDNAAITPVDKEVAKEVRKYEGAEYGNPSSIHSYGVRAKKALFESRRTAADFFHARASDIFFPSGGTESNNLAIIGHFNHLLEKGISPKRLRMITSKIEHASVLECAKYLEKKGVAVDHIGVNEEGIVNLDELESKLNEGPEERIVFLISIMYVNNELGTIQPIREIGSAIRRYNKRLAGYFHAVFHIDASQAPLFIDVDVRSLGADIVTVDGQKIYGPRGAGLLWKRNGINLLPILYGGGQEMGLRSGTENLGSVAGMAKALEIAGRRRERDTARLRNIRDNFIGGLKRILPRAELNGSQEKGVPYIVNVSIPGADNEYFVLRLDAKGIACSTKSSCMQGEEESYVVKALGKGGDAAKSSVRFSFGRDITTRQVEYVLKVIKTVI